MKEISLRRIFVQSAKMKKKMLFFINVDIGCVVLGVRKKYKEWDKTVQFRI